MGNGSENGEVGDDVYEEKGSVNWIDLSMQGDRKETLAEPGVAIDGLVCKKIIKIVKKIFYSKLGLN